MWAIEQLSHLIPLQIFDKSWRKVGLQTAFLSNTAVAVAPNEGADPPEDGLSAVFVEWRHPCLSPWKAKLFYPA